MNSKEWVVLKDYSEPDGKERKKGTVLFSIGKETEEDKRIHERLVNEGFITEKKYKWEEAKTICQEKYAFQDELTFPKLDNFDSDVFVPIGLESKQKTYLAVPYEIEKYIGKGKTDVEKGIKFFDESNKRGAKYFYDKAITKAFYEHSAKIKNVVHRIWSEEQIEKPNVHLTGTVVDLRDYKRIGDRATVPVSAPVLIVDKVSEPELKLQEIENFCSKIKTGEAFRNNAFGVLRHPEWFEETCSTWLLTSPHAYPLHFAWLDVSRENEDQGGVGRSHLMERMNKLVGNEREIFSMEYGTSKGLTVSFKREIAETGYLLETENAFVDELFAIIDKVAGRESQLNEFFKELNSILEWRNRLTKSGNTPFVNIKPRARVFCAGNAPKGTRSMNDVANVVSIPFLERLLPYIHSEMHMDFIKPNRAKVNLANSDGKLGEIEVPTAQWLKIVQNMPVEMPNELKLVEKLKHSAEQVTISDRTIQTVLKDSKLNTIFERRGAHHIVCLLDGIFKLNNLEAVNEWVLDKIHGKNPNPLVLEIGDVEQRQVEQILTEVLRSWA